MNDELLERLHEEDRLTAEAAMLRECITREIGRAQAKLATMHAKLLAGEFPTRADGVNLHGDVFRVVDGFVYLYEKVYALKKLKGEA